MRHLNAIQRVLFAADGRHIVSLGNDHAVCHWDAATGQETGRYRLPDLPEPGDRPELDLDLRLLRALGGRLPREFGAPTALSPDGNILATCSLEGLRLFRAAALDSYVPAQSR